MRELEMSIINYILINPEKLSIISDEIHPDYFSDKESRFCYISMLKINEEGKDVDFFSINHYLKSHRMNLITNEFQNELANHFETYDENLIEHLSILTNASIKKSCTEVFDKNIKYDSHSTDEEVLDNIIKSLNDVKAKINKVVEEDVESQLSELDEEVERISRGEFEPVVFGLPELDKNFSFNFSDLVIVAGRPGMGKTAFVISALEWFNFKGYRPTMISLEMSSKQIYQRMICQKMNLSISDIRKNNFQLDNYYQSRENVKIKLNGSTIFDKEFHIKQIESIIQKKSTQGTRAIVIDYLQLIDGGYGGNKNNEVGDITRRLKLAAKKYNVAIILLSQLSRTVESRQNKRPMLSDLRDSGSIEQDADSVLFLYREGYYNDNANPQDAEVIISKNRHGSTGYSIDKFIDYAGIFKNKLN